MKIKAISFRIQWPPRLNDGIISEILEKLEKTSKTSLEYSGGRVADYPELEAYAVLADLFFLHVYGEWEKDILVTVQKILSCVAGGAQALADQGVGFIVSTEYIVEINSWGLAQDMALARYRGHEDNLLCLLLAFSHSGVSIVSDACLFSSDLWHDSPVRKWRKQEAKQESAENDEPAPPDEIVTREPQRVTIGSLTFYLAWPFESRTATEAILSGLEKLSEKPLKYKEQKRGETFDLTIRGHWDQRVLTEVQRLLKDYPGTAAADGHQGFGLLITHDCIVEISAGGITQEILCCAQKMGYDHRLLKMLFLKFSKWADILSLQPEALLDPSNKMTDDICGQIDESEWLEWKREPGKETTSVP